jgi:monoterpene epsilon-lactone hydrolase
MASPGHQRLVAALTAVGTVLTPTTAPSSEELREKRESEASADFVIPDGTTVVRCRYGTVDCFCLDVGQHRRTVIYFHGGGYVYTHAADALVAIAALSRCCELRAVAPEYRRAPESPFPAAVGDAVAVYRALLAGGVSNTDIVMAGDSAGGGLALACLIASRRAGLQVPAAGIVFSPWTDLAVDGASADAVEDPVVNGAGLRMMAGVYVDGADPRDPLASPLYATDGELA